MDIDLVDGWTGDLDFQLHSNGVPKDLSGMGTPELILRRSDGSLIDTAGDVTVLDAPTGKVRYSPDPADVSPGPQILSVRWKVTQAGKTVFFPNGRPDRWKVFAV